MKYMGWREEGNENERLVVGGYIWGGYLEWGERRRLVCVWDKFVRKI